MSYNDKAWYVAEHFIKNRLEAPQKPSLGINHGRNVPLIVANDTFPLTHCLSDPKNVCHACKKKQSLATIILGQT